MQKTQSDKDTKAENTTSTASPTNNNNYNNSSSSNNNKGVTWGKSETAKESESELRSRRATLRSEQSFKRRTIQDDNHGYVVLPWTRFYRCWWGTSVFFSIFTIFFETYQISFSPAGLTPHNDAASILGFLFMAIFVLDILLNFNLAFYNERDDLVTDRRLIAKNYLRCMFWVDLIGVFPFYLIALAATGEMGNDSDLARYLSLLRLFRLVRLHRVKQLFDNLQYNIHVSLTALTLTRNFGAAMIWTHFAACTMYFIARQYDYDDERTWVGGQVYESNSYERYVTALYWSVVTFTTVGYVR